MVLSFSELFPSVRHAGRFSFFSANDKALMVTHLLYSFY